MKVYKSTDLNVVFNTCVATIGFFDGVHQGHRYLLNQLKNLAQAEGCESVVITFAVHPRKVLNSDFQPALLTTTDEKLLQLETTGIDACVVLDFDLDMSKLSALQFLKEILFEKYKVRTLLIGHDHRFGHNRAETFDDYVQYGKDMGMKIVQAKRFSTPEFQHISSSEVRHALQCADLDTARRILSYSYSIKGKVVAGFKVGRKIGFPTANIESNDPDKLIPLAGVYAVYVKLGNESYEGMMNIGNRPTLENCNKLSLEVHILNFDRDIYDQNIEVIFEQKIRDEIKFNSIEELMAQLEKDKINVQQILNKRKVVDKI